MRRMAALGAPWLLATLGCMAAGRAPAPPPPAPPALMAGPEDPGAQGLAGIWRPFSPRKNLRWSWHFRVEAREGEVRCFTVYDETTDDYVKGYERPGPCFRFRLEGRALRGVDRFNDPIEGTISPDGCEMTIRVRTRLTYEVRENVYTYRRTIS